MSINNHITNARKELLEASANIKDAPQDKQSFLMTKLAEIINLVDTLHPLINSIDQTDKAEKVSSFLNKEGLKGLENETDSYKLMLLRLEPQTVKGQRISGYLKTFSTAITIPDLIEKVGKQYAGGKYQIRVINDKGQYLASKTFEISGAPKLGDNYAD